MLRKKRKQLKPLVLRNERGITVSGENRPVVLSSNCHDVTVEGCEIRESAQVAIYVNDGCSGNQILNNTIDDCDGVGIYLDSRSHHNLLRGNTITNVGKWISGADFPLRFRRFGQHMREGIAVDDSHDNEIVGNYLKNTGLAGITLYRNCAEFGTPARGEGANRNLIANNLFEDIRVGIWNAAREWRDLKNWDCADAGQFVRHRDVPDQPYQQYFDWFSVTVMFYVKELRNPFRPFGIWKVPDIALDNDIMSDNRFINVKHKIITNKI